MSVIITCLCNDGPTEGDAVQGVALTVLMEVVGSPEEAMPMMRQAIMDFLVTHPALVGKIVIGPMDDIKLVAVEEPPLGIDP